MQQDNDPGEIKDWRLGIRLGGAVDPADPGKLAYEGSTEWLYRDGFQGTEEEARIETLAWLAKTAREAGYTGPQTCQYVPLTAEDE